MARSTPRKFGKIWTSAPHEKDGIFVEIMEKVGSVVISINDIWLPDEAACRAWILAQGIETIRYA